MTSVPQCETCTNYIKENALHCNCYNSERKPKYVLFPKKECPAYHNNSPIKEIQIKEIQTQYSILGEIEDMERWKEVFADTIPKAVYQIQLINGEKQGLTIELSSSHTCVMINFGMVQAVRMLDEGIVQSNLYSDNEIQKYKDNDFQNIIYEVQDGEFAEQINQISDGYGEALNLKHYIVTEWEPAIEVSKM